MPNVNQNQSIFQEMMQPKWLHFLLSWALPSQAFKLFITMNSLRSEILRPTFLHTHHEASHQKLKAYWSNQSLLAQKGDLPLLHPLMKDLTNHWSAHPNIIPLCIKILSGFIYEIDTQWSLFGLARQRERMIHNLSQISLLLWAPLYSDSPPLSLPLKDIEWCQKVIFYQYRGLFVLLFDIDPSIFKDLREEIYRHRVFESDYTWGFKIFISYHLFLASLIENEVCESCHEYSQPSYIGIFNIFYHLLQKKI